MASVITDDHFLLNQIVIEMKSQHRYRSAAFFAEKAFFLTGEKEDAFQLADCLILGDRYKEAIRHLKSQQSSLISDLRFRLLLAKSYMACKMWDESLEILGDQQTPQEPKHPLSAAICTIRGEVLLALDSRARAAHWLTQAILIDPHSFDAFELLVSKGLLTSSQERELVGRLAMLGSGEEEGKREEDEKEKEKEEEENWDQNKGLSRKEETKRENKEREKGKEGDQIERKDTSTSKQEKKETKKVKRLRWIIDYYASGIKDDFFSSKKEKYERLAASGLALNCDVLLNRATDLYSSCKFQEALKITREIIERNGDHFGVRELHVSLLVELSLKNELFLYAHALIETSPQDARSWYAAGCYYLMLERLQQARKFFVKATTIDSSFGPAWIAFGHTFSQKDEHEQAVSAYRHASGLLTGSHLPHLCISIELIRTEKRGNLHEAMQVLTCARELYPKDPLIYNEQGVIAYLNSQFDLACKNFLVSIELLCGDDELSRQPTTEIPIDNPVTTLKLEERLTKHLSSIPLTWEPLLFNMAHSFRRLGKWAKALSFYQMCSMLQPQNPTIFAAIGLTYHQSGRLDKAIENYHQSLGLKSEGNRDTADLLHLAVQEWSEFENHSLS